MKIERTEHNGLMFDCPGCGSLHVVHDSGDGPRWTFNGDYQKPTLSPSVLVTWKNQAGDLKRVCHSFVNDGRIQFLNDCTHALAGMTVDLPDVE